MGEGVRPGLARAPNNPHPPPPGVTQQWPGPVADHQGQLLAAAAAAGGAGWGGGQVVGGGGG